MPIPNSLNSNNYILIKGAKINNLNNLDIAIPRNKFVVITGLSGSGKSSLVFDTLYAEGQRRYVESLSAYARQFLGRFNKPPVDYIKGISPAIAIEQKVTSTNPRSTLGTTSEIYDYLKLLFARIGKTYSPISNDEVKKNTVLDVMNFILSHNVGERLYLLSPINLKSKKSIEQKLNLLLKNGYSRVYLNGEIHKINNLKINIPNNFYLLVERIIVPDNDIDFNNRLADSIETAFFEGGGTCVIEHISSLKNNTFNDKYEKDNIVFLEPSTHLFSFNNSHGACPNCEGLGLSIGFDPKLVIPNPDKSIYNHAIVPWQVIGKKYYEQLIQNAYKFDFPIHKPWHLLSSKDKACVWEGNKYFTGISKSFDILLKEEYSLKNKIHLTRYQGQTSCLVCKGTRLRKEAMYVKINNKTIGELVNLPLHKLKKITGTFSLTEYEKTVSKNIITELQNRLSFLIKVGLGYLTINRNSSSLSGGESQRINLATSLSSSLVGALYILDEPSIGLHSKDTEQLIEVLKTLTNLGNTVIVVEHDEDIIKSADTIFEIGPKAGTHGGKLVAEGDFKTFLKSNSLTSDYLSKRKKISIPKNRRLIKHFITIHGAKENNLKNITVNFALDCLTVVTGVSGSGKSTLVKNILLPSLEKEFLDFTNKKTGIFSKISGSYSHIRSVEFIDQNPIGKSSRSNPVTYTKAYDDIRNLFTQLSLSKELNYQPKHFSFNVEGGRCEKCKGEGALTIQMQFMANVKLVCDQCNGLRFKKEILEVKFNGKNIFDILNLTIDNALVFFTKHKQFKIISKLQTLKNVGMGYVTLGQPSSSLSGGELQRVKLSAFLAKGQDLERKIFIFDEPTTGLHFHDINKLLSAFNALIDNGHSIIVIEHNLELIKCADYIIDLGPYSGEKGGNLVFEGTPEKLVKCKTSYTADYLKNKLNG